MIEILNGARELVNYKGDFKIRIYLNKEYEDYPQHWHTDTEIIMPVENSYTVVIDEKTYNLDVNDIIVIPSCELHQIFAPPTGHRVIIQFDCTILYCLTGFNTAFHIFHPCVFITPTSMPDAHDELSTLISEMVSEYFLTQPFREASIYSMLIRFFTILGRNCINKNDMFLNIKKHKKLEYLNAFLKVCNYINDHCTENIKIDDVANIAGFSKYHFTRLFKQLMNISWYEYLIKRRILLAEQLLVQPDLSITQVAMKSGFSSLATFNRLFKAMKCCTPTEYRHLYSTHSKMQSETANLHGSR
ncbi:MAG: AraC family transcriptional regulator [Bacillota bacterium]